LQSASALNGNYAAVAGAVVTGTGSNFSVTTSTSGAIQFYRLSQ
jgi:hypothetical protein